MILHLCPNASNVWRINNILAFLWRCWRNLCNAIIGWQCQLGTLFYLLVIDVIVIKSTCVDWMLENRSINQNKQKPKPLKTWSCVFISYHPQSDNITDVLQDNFLSNTFPFLLYTYCSYHILMHWPIFMNDYM